MILEGTYELRMAERYKNLLEKEQMCKEKEKYAFEARSKAWENLEEPEAIEYADGMLEAARKELRKVKGEISALSRMCMLYVMKALDNKRYVDCNGDGAGFYIASKEEILEDGKGKMANGSLA